MGKHVNAFFTVDGARRPVGTFTADQEGTADALHALLDAKRKARDSGHDVGASKSELAFVDTELLADDGKTVREFASLEELSAAGKAKKKGA